MVEWKLGTLSEWLIAAAFKKAGFPNYFWNVSLDGEQCDVLVVDDKRLFIVECKRSHSIDSQFKEGIVKLKTLAELLKPTNIEVIKILFTCINSKVESPEGIDLVVDKSNYSSFVNNPCSLV
jgi:hypothetical protein